MDLVMVLEHLLSQKRAAILGRWFQLILETYPADTSRFLKKEKDRFVNPVGYTISHFPPSQTIVFIFLLKKAIREELANKIVEKQAFEELLKFESRIDKLVLLALDIYMKCREKVYEIRINEIKTEKERALKLLERTNLIMESQREQNPKTGKV